ncbi:hypothetical protein ACFOJ6_13655 [Gordonia humi]|uniref:hypothetical protein n=1 Tax=Gordonia humi TaxID=686429 RepID=UPI00361BDA1C
MPPLADLVDEYVAAKNRETALHLFGTNVIRTTLESVTLPTRLETAFVDTALDMCRDELETIMGRVDEHRDLIARHPDSAEAALATGELEAWETVEQILGDYDQLLAEYRRQIRLANDGLGGPLIGSVQCRDFLDVSSYWQHQRRTTSILEGYPDQTIRAWFRPADTRGRSRAEHLLAVADSGPWMPDARDLAAATGIAEQLCRHRWNTGTLGADRQFFARQIANLRRITHDEPLPEQKPAARRLA